MAAASVHPLLFVFFLILCKPSPSSSVSLPFSSYQIVLSLSHSILERVANQRAARGDAVGAARARSIARIIDGGFGSRRLWKLTWSLGWEYGQSSTWMSFGKLAFDSDVNELLRDLGELTRVRSEAERVAWVDRNYCNVIRIVKDLSARLLKAIGESGPLREVMEMVQKEVVEGDLLKDCLELGGNDFKSLIHVVKDIVLQYTSTSTDL